MAPKKAAETKLSSAPAEAPEEVLMGGDAEAEVSKESSKAARKVPTHPSTMDMVKEALKELDSRKGVSAQAIRTFIKEKHPTVDDARLKFLVRKALVKGLESGDLVRPANSTTTGARGRFRLAIRNPKDVKPPKTKEVKENANPNIGKDKTRDAGSKKEKPVKTKSTTEEDKPKKTKMDSSSKVAPAKKPKAKKAVEESESKAPVKKGGKKGALEAEEGLREEAEAMVPKKGKVAQKASNGGEEGNADAQGASRRRGKKAAEK